MHPRDFLAVIGGAAMLPFAAHAEQEPVSVIGWLDHSTPQALSPKLIAAFRDGLNEAGIAEARDTPIEFRYTNNQPDQLTELATDLVRRRAAVIIATGMRSTAVNAIPGSIPIVCYTGADAAERPRMRALDRMSRKVSSVSVGAPRLNEIRLKLLDDLVPKPGLIALLWDAIPRSRVVAVQLREMEATARSLDRQILFLQAGDESELATAFETLVALEAKALLVGPSPFFNTRSQTIVALAARNGLPAIYPQREFAAAGGLMSYGANEANEIDAHRQLGNHVGRILKGEQVPESVELPGRCEFVLNLRTAQTLGLTIPPELLARADEIVEQGAVCG